MAARAARVVAGEESEEDEVPVPAPAPAPTAAPAPAAGTASPAVGTAAPLEATPVATRRIVRGEESEDDEEPAPAAPAAATAPAPAAAPAAAAPAPALFHTDSGTSTDVLVVPADDLRVSGRQRRLADAVSALDRDVASRTPTVIRGVKKPLVLLATSLAKTEKVVQDVSYQFKLFNEDLRELDESLARLAFDILPQHTIKAAAASQPAPGTPTKA